MPSGVPGVTGAAAPNFPDVERGESTYLLAQRVDSEARLAIQTLQGKKQIALGVVYLGLLVWFVGITTSFANRDRVSRLAFLGLFIFAAGGVRYIQYDGQINELRHPIPPGI